MPYPLTTLEEVRGGMEAMRLLDLGGPLLTVDLSERRDTDAVVSWIRDQLPARATTS